MVFDDYINYYLDDELARKYTIRQWWTRCAEKRDLQPSDANYPPPPPQELANFLVSTLLEACVFPGKYTAGENSMKRACHLTDPILDEQRQDDEEMKVGSYRRIRLDHELMERIRRHEFKHLLFPSHLLPMKVSGFGIDIGDCIIDSPLVGISGPAQAMDRLREWWTAVHEASEDAARLTPLPSLGCQLRVPALYQR